MEAVIAQFIDHIEHDKNGAGQANGKAKDIDQGIAPLSPEISQSDKDVTFEHKYRFLL
jgi:hypothetical protein